MPFFRLSFLALLLTCTSLHLHGQSAALYTQCYGGNNNEVITKILPAADSGFIFAGHTWSTNQQVSGQHGARDMWITKCDIAGQIEWQRCLGGSSEDAATTMFAKDSSFIIGGFTASADGNVNDHIGADDFWLVKLRNDNVLQWKKCFGGSYNEQMNAVIPAADGGYLMAGFTFSNDGDVSGLHGPVNTWADAWVVKTDAARNILWQRCLGGTDADAAYRIVELNSGNIMVAASTNSTNGDVTQSHGNRDVWVVKLDAAGSLLQQKTFGGSYDESPNDMILTSGNHLVITGYSFSSNGDLTGNYFNGTSYWEDAWVLEIDTAMNLLWQKNLGGTHSDVGTGILETANGYLLAAESSSTDFDRSQSFGNKDYWVVQLNATGNIQWEQSFGGNSFDFLRSIAFDKEGKLLMGGFSTSSNLCGLGNTDCWLVRADTTLIPAGLFPGSDAVASVNAWPVPFGNTLHLAITNGKDIRRVVVYDGVGRVVYETNQVPASLLIATANWARGLYLISLQSGGASAGTLVVKE